MAGEIYVINFDLSSTQKNFIVKSFVAHYLSLMTLKITLEKEE